jgi:large subunit ribosomal protein L24
MEKKVKKPKLKKNDLVVVIAGRDRGRQGKILRVLPAEERVIVERVNMIKRHTRPNPSKNIAGGISEKEATIHISNVMLVDPDRNVGTRIGRRRDSEGNPERVAKKSGAVLA